MHCQHPKYKAEDIQSGKVSPWDTLQEWWDGCADFQPKEENSEEVQKWTSDGGLSFYSCITDMSASYLKSDGHGKISIATFYISPAKEPNVELPGCGKVFSSQSVYESTKNSRFLVAIKDWNPCSEADFNDAVSQMQKVYKDD